MGCLEFQYHGITYRFAVSSDLDTIQMEMTRTRTFYEVAELEFLRCLIPEGAHVVDVGANIGNHTVYFQQVCRARRVTVFEPNPAVIGELLYNLKQNGCDSTYTGHLGVALGATPGRASIVISSQDQATRNRGGARITTDPQGSIRIIRLDSLDFEPIDLLKIDVEGMALEVLEGATGLFEKGFRPVLFVELERIQLPAFEAWATRYGYRLRAATMMYQDLLNIVCIADDRSPHSGVAAGRWPLAMGESSAKMGRPIKLSERALPIGLPRIEPASLGLSEEDYQRLRTVYDVQSCVFASEILSTLWSLYPNNIHNLSLLDVGSRTGAGSELLRYLHHPSSFSRIKLSVTALDTDDTYIDYARIHFPELRYLQQDIFDSGFTERFDIVLCSHVIEHVDDPANFIARAQALARRWVILAAPFEEKNLIPGHRSRLDFDFFQTIGAHDLRVYRSLTWHGSLACIVVLPGSSSS